MPEDYTDLKARVQTAIETTNDAFDDDDRYGWKDQEQTVAIERLEDEITRLLHELDG